MEEYDLTEKLDEAWTVDDMFITITSESTSIILDQSNLLTYEVKWQGDCVDGVISFRDTEEILKALGLGKGESLKENKPEVEIAYISQKGSPSLPEAPFKRKFTVIRYSQSDDKYPVVEFILTDQLNFTTLNTFKNISLAEKTPQEVIEEIIKECKIEDKITVASESTEKMNLKIGAHTNINDILDGIQTDLGLTRIIDRHDTYFVDGAALDPSKARHTGETFFYEPEEVQRRDQVLEFEVLSGSLESLVQTMTASTNDVTDSKLDADIDQEAKSSTTTKPINPGALSDGTRQSTVEHPDMVLDAANNNEQLSIWVPGWNGNRMYQKITVELPKTASASQTDNSETFKGDWIVTSVRDKIINSYFIQELILRRA